MNCCTNCFLDKELNGFIYQNSNEVGTCDYCSTEETNLINVQELQAQFIGLLEIYEINVEQGIDVVEILQNTWRIFKLKDSEVIRKLLFEVCEGLDQEIIEKVTSRLIVKSAEETTELIENWNLFKKEIKSTNRFFIENSVDFDAIEETLPVWKYSKGKIFYRSRISDKSGYPKEKMGKPPHKLARAGRANPQGIQYLYVAQSINTTLYEARATFLDYVSVGEFRLTEDINIITLRSTFQVSPFLDGYSIDKYVQNKPFIDLLEEELARPLRRQDNELDYLPTQYLCEYIKSLGYHGVEYGSAMHEGGINLVIFDDDKYECVKTKVFEISKIDIESNEVHV